MTNPSQILGDVLDDLRPKGDRWRGCLAGDFSGNVDAPLQGWKYVRIPIAGSGNYALGMFPSGSVPGTAYNSSLMIEYDPLNNQRIIVGADTQALGASVGGGAVPDPGGFTLALHAWTHQLGGNDQAIISYEQMGNLQVSPSTTNTQHVVVSGGVCQVGGALIKVYAPIDVDLSLKFPVSGVKYVWITLSSAGSVVVIDPPTTDITLLTLPATPNHLLAFVMLQAYQPITWANIKSVQSVLDDVRGWCLSGNSGVSASTDWMGSANDADVVFKRYGAEIVRLTTTAIVSLQPVRVKPTGTAGIQLDANAATGNFTLSLSPENLTGNRRVTFGNVTGTIALGAGTITSITTNDVTVAAHTHAITPSLGLIGNGTSQWQIPVTGTTPFAPAWSGFKLAGSSGGMTVFDVASTKILVFTVENHLNLTMTGYEVTTLNFGPSWPGWEYTFPDLSGTLALGAGTLTSATTNNVTVAAHTHAVTGAPALLGNGTAQYQTIVTGANPYVPVYSGFLLDGMTGGKTVFAVTNTKVLTFTAANTIGVTFTGGDTTLAFGATGRTYTFPDTDGTVALASGISGGQTLYGGTAANDDLILHGTSHTTRDMSYVVLQPTFGNIAVGAAAGEQYTRFYQLYTMSVNTNTPYVGIKSQTYRNVAKAGASADHAFYAQTDYAAAADAGAGYTDGYGSLVQYTSATNSLNYTIIGGRYFALITSSATISGIRGLQFDATVLNGTVTNLFGAKVWVGVKAEGGDDKTGTATNAYGIQIVGMVDTLSTGTLTNRYGIEIGNMGTGATHYAIKTGTGLVSLGASVQCATGFGCNGATPQTAYSIGAALAAYATGAFGLNSDANMSALVAQVNAMALALKANGIAVV